MEALELVDNPHANNKKGKTAKLDAESCIGCGVCAYKCPSDSLTLVRRAEVTTPPQNPREYNRRYMVYREEAKQKKHA